MTLFETLARNIQGDVDNKTRQLDIFSKDESIFRSVPQIIVAPRNEEDIQRVVEIASTYGASIVPRGGGSGTTGAALGDEIVLDFRKYMHAILAVKGDRAWVEPGVFLSELNRHVFEKGLVFGPDPGSRDYACMGGVVGNNAAGAHALAYGMTRSHVEEIRCILASGEVISTKDMNQKFSLLVDDMKNNIARIAETSVGVSKNSSGLYLEAFMDDTPSFAKLLCGSEGKLAVFGCLCVKLMQRPAVKTFAVLPFENKFEAAGAVPVWVQTNPACMELVDDVIQNALLQANPEMSALLGLAKGGASLWVEWFGDKPRTKNMTCYLQDERTIGKVWSFRSEASKILHRLATNRQPLRCIEDACVPLEVLPAYMQEVDALLKEHDCHGAMFGHIGNGHLHINPWVDVTQPDLWLRLDRLMEDFYAIVLRYQGTISGEHGDGYLRQKYVPQQWKGRVSLFDLVYAAFDPEGRFRPKTPPVMRTF